MRKKIVVLTGAGVSAESGVKTFRDSGGLWEEHKIEDVATFEAWEANPEMVLKFYNERRKQLYEVEPNEAHKALVRLEEKYDVHIITQNVDDLHERAGSKNVLHLHGELKKSRSTLDDETVYDIDGWELNLGDVDKNGAQLRPHIVWFGEDVPEIANAAKIAARAYIFIVIGSSLNVYPAAGLLESVPFFVTKFLVDPNARENYNHSNLTIIKEKAGSAVPRLVDELLSRV